MSKARSSNKVVDIVFGELLAKLAVVDSKQTSAFDLLKILGEGS